MEYNNNMLDEAYENYFGKKKEKVPQIVNKVMETVGTINNKRLCAEGNIGTVNQFGDSLRQLLNVVWGTNWGELTHESSSNEDKDNVKLPRITYSTNLREVAEGFSPKPMLEDVEAGQVGKYHTGEHYKVYRQFFDCIIEFNIRAATSKDCSELTDRFEDAMVLHAGHLKRKGVSELYYLKEVPARYSNHFVESIPTKCLYYYVRLEKIRVVSVSSLREIETRLSSIGENSDDNGMEFTIQE